MKKSGCHLVTRLFFVPLRLCLEGRLHLRKIQINLVFHSICTTSDFVEGTSARKNSKIFWFFTRLIVPLQNK